ncbi:copper transport protein ATOX1 [Solea senegalensis]|uniref:Copper transport protein ATOX1 n=1 Tax=Solea senegalensis TaxID=28829 RepID=A0AAV6SMB9_SOLSE|nr:copper transport protein ATOX1 [Solea senegalensis]
MTKYEFQVEMTCEGCSGAISRILSKQEGVNAEEKWEESHVQRHQMSGILLHSCRTGKFFIGQEEEESDGSSPSFKSPEADTHKNLP